VGVRDKDMDRLMGRHRKTMRLQKLRSGLPSGLHHVATVTGAPVLGLGH